MPSSILPEVAFPRVKVIVNSGELPSAVMLRDVTRTLEESIRRVPGVTEIRSTTSRGSAEINLDSRWGTDLNLTVQRVQSQIEGAEAQVKAFKEQSASVRAEADSVAPLVEKMLLPRPRLLQLQRSASSLDGSGRGTSPTTMQWRARPDGATTTRCDGSHRVGPRFWLWRRGRADGAWRCE